MVELFSPLFEMAFVGELTKHAFEDDAIGTLQTESAGDLARSDLAGLAADERK
jgi:hypothetical protein